MNYLWRIPESYPESLIGEYLRDRSPDRFIFRRGVRVPEDVGTPVLRFNASCERLLQYDCLPNNAMVPLLRGDLATLLLERAPADVQLVKAEVLALDGQSDAFFLLNVTAMVTGIDKSQSTLTYLPGTKQILSFKRLAYLDDCLGEHELARDAEYTAHLLVSEGLVASLRARRVTGVEFCLPSEIV